MRIKLMTYNIQHGLLYRIGGIDLDKTVGNIAASGADIVSLNEVRGEGCSDDYTAQAAYIAKKLGWHYFFAPAISFGGNNPYGNAVVSRFPITSARKIIIPDPPVRDEDAYYETRSALSAVIDVDGTPFTVFVTHMGLAKSEQRSAVATVTVAIDAEKATGGPFALCGDFNMEPDNCILAPVFAAMTDTTPLLDGAKTFPSDDPSIKIDYILVSGGAAATAAQVLPFETHDHRPVIADIII